MYYIITMMIKSKYTGKMIKGSVSFWYGSRLIGEAVVYDGEGVPEAFERERRYCEYFNREALPYLFRYTNAIKHGWE